MKGMTWSLCVTLVLTNAIWAYITIDGATVAKHREDAFTHTQLALKQSIAVALACARGESTRAGITDAAVQGLADAPQRRDGVTTAGALSLTFADDGRLTAIEPIIEAP